MSNPDSPVRQIYDALANKYNNKVGLHYSAKLKWTLVEKYTQAHFHCLDVGVANGILAFPTAQISHKVTGIDISRNMLAIAKQEAQETGVSNLDLIEASASQLPFATNVYDLIYSFSTLVLVSDALSAYTQIFQALKSGGVAILDITGRYNLSQLHWNKYYTRMGHTGINSYSLPQIAKTFTDIGFSILEVHPSGFLDQWKYVPLVRYLKPLDKLAHLQIGEQDLDFRVSKLLPRLANRWYFILSKPA